MHKLTIEVDLDLNISPDYAREIVENLIGEMETLAALISSGKAANTSGLILSPLEDDELVGNWRIDPK